MVCAHKNPSVLEMKYNIGDKVIPVKFLSVLWQDQEVLHLE